MEGGWGTFPLMDHNISFKTLEKRNFIYITYQDSNENSIPIGECIEKINEKPIRNIEEIKEISKIESIQLMNGEIYYLI